MEISRTLEQLLNAASKANSSALVWLALTCGAVRRLPESSSCMPSPHTFTLLSTLVCTRHFVLAPPCATAHPCVSTLCPNPVASFAAVVLLYPDVFAAAPSQEREEVSHLHGKTLAHLAASGMSSLDCSMESEEGGNAPLSLDWNDEALLVAERDLVAVLFLHDVESQLRHVQIQMTLQRRTNKRQVVVSQSSHTTGNKNLELEDATCPVALRIAEQQLLLLKALLLSCLTCSYCWGTAPRSSPLSSPRWPFGDFFDDSDAVGQWGMRADAASVYDECIQACDRLLKTEKQTTLADFLANHVSIGSVATHAALCTGLAAAVCPPVSLPSLNTADDVRCIGYVEHSSHFLLASDMGSSVSSLLVTALSRKLSSAEHNTLRVEIQRESPPEPVWHRTLLGLANGPHAKEFVRLLLEKHNRDVLLTLLTQTHRRGTADVAIGCLMDAVLSGDSYGESLCYVVQQLCELDRLTAERFSHFVGSATIAMEQQHHAPHLDLSGPSRLQRNAMTLALLVQSVVLQRRLSRRDPLLTASAELLLRPFLERNTNVKACAELIQLLRR